MDFEKIKSLFDTFVSFIQNLLRSVNVIGSEEDEEKAAGYKGHIDELIGAIKDALGK